MRLVDKWIMHVSKEHASVLSNPPVSFVVDNIARDYYHDDRDEFEAGDFPYAVPPWDFCFVEWIEPRTVRLSGCVYPTHPLGMSSTTQMGASIVSLGDVKGVEVTINALDYSCAKSPEWPEFKAKAHSSSRVFLARIFSEFQGRFIDWEMCLFIFTDNDGLATCNILVGNGLAKFPSDEQRGRINNMCQSVYHILGFAFTFSHCKNVKTVDETELMQPPPKVMRRLKLPTIKRYTLKIDGRQSDGRESNGIGQSPAYHLCRGHFATYGPEKPLFGRLVGKFWIPAHTKGSKAAGEVKKSYSAETE